MKLLICANAGVEDEKDHRRRHAMLAGYLAGGAGRCSPIRAGLRRIGSLKQFGFESYGRNKKFFEG